MTTTKTAGAKTNAQRQQALRDRRAETPEVRGIFAHPDDRPAIKLLAEKLARRRAKLAAKRAP